MREIGSVSSARQSTRLISYLQLQQIAATAQPEADRWVIWVEDDDHVHQSRQLLTEFLADPDAQRYVDAERQAELRGREAAKQQQKTRRSATAMGRRWQASGWHRSIVTPVLSFLCILVVLVCTDWSSGRKGSFGLPATCNDSSSELLDALWMEEPLTVTILGRRWRMPVEPHLWETLKSGEVWRLVTPILIHMDVLHILLNLMWLRSLGMPVERLLGSWRFLGLVIVLAVVSNLTQYFWAGPRFGGMSGVVFGLIGYVWMQGRTQPQNGLGLMPDQVVYSIAWLLLCMTGAFGAIANGAHVGGFLMGILIGSRRSLVGYLKGKT